jgi:hypothetical protein
MYLSGREVIPWTMISLTQSISAAGRFPRSLDLSVCSRVVEEVVLQNDRAPSVGCRSIEGKPNSPRRTDYPGDVLPGRLIQQRSRAERHRVDLGKRHAPVCGEVNARLLVAQHGGTDVLGWAHVVPGVAIQDHQALQGVSRKGLCLEWLSSISSGRDTALDQLRKRSDMNFGPELHSPKPLDTVPDPTTLLLPVPPTRPDANLVASQMRPWTSPSTHTEHRRSPRRTPPSARRACTG